MLRQKAKRPRRGTGSVAGSDSEREEKADAQKTSPRQHLQLVRRGANESVGGYLLRLLEEAQWPCGIPETLIIAKFSFGVRDKYLENRISSTRPQTILELCFIVDGAIVWPIPSRGVISEPAYGSGHHGAQPPDPQEEAGKVVAAEHRLAVQHLYRFIENLETVLIGVT